ncbi:hypothetical protein DWW96_10845 [Eubacterium sp. AF17-7]|mgnify:CR=1 FL=1|uniref:hypothetical protein n=1 Tax=Eubacterium sp. AF17-7 TaxID=2293105 RepID=UPI000E4D687B|nr:hypothetical protein [Eubacterium sp. AF17-7]RGG63431.1 hypothetical protein DWW96_10845 [Eubacterium sp. AF17-7]
MPTPPKPHIVLINEGKSHRTKAELKQREEAEKALVTGEKLKERKEVKENPAAHKEFRRISKLLKNIEKNDALYEPIINRYCQLQAECKDFEEKREQVFKSMLDLESSKEDFEKNDDIKSYYKMILDMQKNMVNIDKQVQSKRIMLLNIEKENIMTIASALRSIPKKVDEESTDPLKGLNKYG